MKVPDTVLKAVIFDLDGTLYNSNAIKIDMAFRNISQLYMLISLLDVRNKCRGIDFYTKNRFHVNLFNEMQKRTGKNASGIEQWYFEVFYPGFVTLLKKKYRARKEMESALTSLKHNGIHTAVLSDYLFVRERLEAIRLESALFDIIASSEDYGVLKPSRRPLLDIALQLGVKEEQVLVIGDRDDTDGKGAEMAKMQYLNINKSKRQGLSCMHLLSYSVSQ